MTVLSGLPGGTAGVVRLRPLRGEDAEALYAAYARNRAHLRPWEPRRAASFFSVPGQAARLREMMRQRAEGRLAPWALVDGGRIVGLCTLSHVVLGAFRSANLGYWVDAEYVGRGLATAAVAEVCRRAESELGLHRIEAGTVPENARSRRVLVKCGFTEIGEAPRYLAIDGVWRDHRLYQRVLHGRPPGPP